LRALERVVALRMLSWLLLLQACSGRPAQPARSPAAAAAAAGPARAAAVPAEATSSRAAAAPALAIDAVTDANGALQIRVRNAAHERVQLAPSLQLERRGEQGFGAVAGEPIALRPASRDGCVELVPGAELRLAPGPLAAAGGGGQTYRFSARACDARYRVDGAAFELP
jgi:hypothetical protein